MAIKARPQIVKTDQSDDLQTINQDVDEYYSKFMQPIDNFRSISNAPGLSTSSNNQTSRIEATDAEQSVQKNLTGLEVNSNRFIESRCHAFYRMIGFPVATTNGFYNAGHDSNQAKTSSGRNSIDTALINNNQDLVGLMYLREVSAQNRRDIFAKQDDISTVYSLMIRHTKPFMMMQEGLGPLDFDIQNKNIDSRKSELNNLKIDPTKIPAYCMTVNHILKPFMVNPQIELAVTPSYKNRVCVPFLATQKDTHVTQNHPALKRPVIEFILRQRLQNSNKDTNFYETVKYILNNKTNDTDNTLEEARITLLALTGQDNIHNVTDDILSNISDFTAIQTSTVNMLTKAIKSCLKQLDLAIRELDLTNSMINLQPLPDTEGPEFGGSIRTDFGLKQPSEIDKQIAIMNLSQMNAQFQSQVDTTKIGGGNDLFAAAVIADISKNFDEPIQKKQRARDELGTNAMKYLRTIEIVTGEVSGLGLIDILSIYCALWAMDIDDLLGLLDNDALNRLKSNFPELTNISVFNQISNRPNIVDTLSHFEKILFNILSFADKTFDSLKRVRLEPRGSSI